MKESELKMMIREELEKIISEEEKEVFKGRFARGLEAHRAEAERRMQNQEADLKRAAAQLQKIAQFLNQMTK